jgi:hypothetical protein
MPKTPHFHAASTIECGACGATIDSETGDVVDNDDESTENNSAAKPAATEVTLSNSLLTAARNSSNQQIKQAKAGKPTTAAKLAIKLNKPADASEVNTLAAAIAKAKREIGA